MLDGDGPGVNPSERAGLGFGDPAACLVYCTRMHFHLNLKASLAPYEDGCVSGNGKGYAENVGVFVNAESAAECERAHLRCDVNAVCVVRRDLLFHSGPQSPGSHAVDVSGRESL